MDQDLGKKETARNRTARFVDQSPWGHRESPFSHLCFAPNEVDVDEVVHSSAWLWQGLKAKSFKPRFAVGYPEEWNALLAQADFLVETLPLISLDLWVFKDLSESEVRQLRDVLNISSEIRLVVAANHLMLWRDFISNSWIQELGQRGQAFLSFLPNQSLQDPFLRPQEVLWELEQESSTLPLLLQDFPSSKSGFYSSLSKKAYARELLAKNPVFISFVQFLNRLGLTSQVLFVQSLISFYLDSKLYKLVQALRYLFDFSFVIRHLRCLCSFLIHHLRSLFSLLYSRGRMIFSFLLYRFFTLLRFFSFPLRKVYWFFEHQLQKRLHWSKKNADHS